MENLKTNFLAKTSDADVKCAIIHYLNRDIAGNKPVVAKLKVDYSQEEYDAFLKLLDFEYDDAAYFDAEPLKATIWLKNGGWIEKDIYSRDWDYHQPPSYKRCDEQSPF